MKEPNVILVDTEDNPIGTEGKLAVHQKGLLHRAFSVCIFNRQNEMLLHQRAFGKYHSPGLWTNACCSHPAPDQPTKEAAEIRLQEEMGFSCDLQYRFKFIYKATFPNGLTEYELDHVFTGIYEGPILPDATEVHTYQFMSIPDIARQLQDRPDQFTPWFRLLFEPVVESITQP